MSQEPAGNSKQRAVDNPESKERRWSMDRVSTYVHSKLPAMVSSRGFEGVLTICHR